MILQYILPVLCAIITIGAIIWLTTTNSRTNENQNQATLWVLLAVVAVVVSYWGLGGYLLFDIDEAIFAEAAREMVETANYLTPSYNYAPRYDKPILIYWFMSLSYKLFGISEFSARFTAALSGTLLVLFTFGFVKRVRGAMPALFASLALLLNIGYFVYSHAAVTDITLCLLIGSSIYAFYLAIHTKNDRWIYATWAAAALALLLKGLVGLFLPSAIAITYLFLTKDLWAIRRFLRLKYILLFLLIAAPWYAAEFYYQGWDFFDSFVMKHQVQRYTSGFKGKSGPFYYYIPVIALCFYPWVAFIPAGLLRGVKELRRNSGGIYLLGSVWFIFVFCFFSYAATKHPNYTLPLLPAVAILAGCVAAEWTERIRNSRHSSGIYIMAALSMLLAVTLVSLPFLNIKMDLPLKPWFFFCLGALFFVNGLYAVVSRSKPMRSFTGMAIITFITLVFLRSTLITVASDSLQRPLYDYGTYVKNLKSVPHVITYEIHKPSLAFYAQRKVQRVVATELDNFLQKADTESVIIITSEKRYRELERAEEFTVIDRRGGYILISNNALLPAVQQAKKIK